MVGRLRVVEHPDRRKPDRPRPLNRPGLETRWFGNRLSRPMCSAALGSLELCRRHHAESPGFPGQFTGGSVVTREETFLPDQIVVGIDVAEPRKGLDLVALDANRNIVASMGRLSVRDAVNNVLEDIRPAMVCIDSPSGWSSSGKSRQAERGLRTLGITAFATGPDPGDHPFYRWMRVGFALFEALSPAYPLYRGAAPENTAAEVFPEATAVLLAGRLRNKGESKRVFRGGILEAYGVGLDDLPNVDRIDAALAALTGVFALEQGSSWVGDPSEGVVLLPVPALPTQRLVRTGDPSSESAQFHRPANLSGLSLAHSPQRKGGLPLCGCGCGAEVRERFKPGHDAKLRSSTPEGGFKR
jgi:hypothetical protein